MGIPNTWRSEIEQLLSESFAWLDGGSADRVPSLCSDDFVLHAPGFDLDREAFTALMTARVEAPYDTRHQWSNLRRIDGDDDAVRVGYTVLAHRRDREAEATLRTVADFEDRWKCAAGDWTLTERSITPVFDAPAG